MRGKWILISVSVVLVAIAAGALSRLRGPAAPAAGPAVNAAQAPAAPPNEVSLAGQIEAQHIIAIGAPMAGSVGEFLVDVGQEVYEGEVLARISNTGLETARESASTAVELAQARLSKVQAAIIAARLEASRARADEVRARGEFDRARRTYLRQQMLHREGATPRLVYEKSERDYASAEAESKTLDEVARQAESRVEDLLKEEQSSKSMLDEKARELEEATIQLQAAEVRSPVNGLVIARKGEAGKQLEAQEQAELFRVAVELSALQVTVTPAPPVLQRLKTGDAALVLIADLGGEGIAGSVKEIKASQVIVAFTSPSPVVKPGMSAQVRIRLTDAGASR